MGPEPVDNVILLADSYKSAHFRLYPPGLTSLYCYFESRGGEFPYTQFFGLQYILKRWLAGPVVTKEKILEAKQILSCGTFNEEGWNYIYEHYGGYLPIKICAVPEGSIIPVKNVLFTVENTDPLVPWLTTYLETILVQSWYPMTVATNSRLQKQVINAYLCDTHEEMPTLSYMLHDFGYRGSTSVESAAIGGAAHLINFMSSDTMAGFLMLQKYYNADITRYTVTASEHSTIISWGKDNELQAYRHMIETIPKGNYSIVCDSYDIWNSLEKFIGGELKDTIIKRGKEGNILAVRPDSGKPEEVCVKTFEILEKHFGSSVNKKGYKVLPHFLYVIQGDGISLRSIVTILEALRKNGWSTRNLSFGSGSSLLQKVDRDTQKYAYKPSCAVINGESHDLYKDPITDPGKMSKKGRLALISRDGIYKTIREEQLLSIEENLLIPVFENGKLLREYSVDEIRQRSQLCESDIDILNFLSEDSVGMG